MAAGRRHRRGRAGPSEALRGLLVDRLRLAHELLELGPDDVDVDGHAGVLEREEADPDRSLHELRPVRGGTLGEEAGQGPVVDDEAVDEDPLGVEPDVVACRLGHRPDGTDRANGGLHGPKVRGTRDI